VIQAGDEVRVMVQLFRRIRLEREGAKGMSRMRVMVVDEEEEFRETVARLLDEQGYEAYLAADGIDALRQIYDVMPQLIVSDTELANLSGFEFLPFVRRRFPLIRIIGLQGAPEDPERRINFVPDSLVAKRPWNPEALVAAAEDLVSRSAVPETEEVDCA
jgi:two-component system, chemotaxis family, sensor histidine kinase and response regulator WspE